MPSAVLDMCAALPSVLSSSARGALVFVIPCGLAFGCYRLSKRMQYVGKDEQLLMKMLTEKVVIQGPTVVFPNPLTTLSYRKRKGISINAFEYLVVNNSETGEIKIVAGPKLYFLGPYESEEEVKLESKKVLGSNDAIHVTDKVSGEARLVRGPATFVPGPTETFSSKLVQPITLNKTQYMKLQDKMTGQIWIEHGEKLLFLEPHWLSLSNSAQQGFSLKKHQFIRLQDSLSGAIRVERGEQIVFPSPYEIKLDSEGVRDAIDLKASEYIVIQSRDSATGERRIVLGPTLYFLGAYESDEEVSVMEKTVLGPNDAIYVTDNESGETRLVKGPTTFVPGPMEVIKVKQVHPYTLNKSQYIKLQDRLTGQIWVEHGEKLLFLEPHWEALTKEVQSAFSLKKHQYIRLRDTLTGVVRVERGEQIVFPSPYEVKLDPEGVRDAIDLKAWEFVVIQEQATGKVRVERGEQLVWLGGSEQVNKDGKQEAVQVNEEHAALIHNLSTGALHLVDTPQLFFPSVDEEVVEVRDRIKLADNEAMVLKDGSGKYHFRYGDPSRGGGEGSRSFFLPPYWEIVELCWSRGRRRERKDLYIKVFDMRAQYMAFEFNCRTSDNVEMILEGTFFWEIVDLPAMLRFTGDASGDVCAHARSCFIQLVSKVSLQCFMDTFNDIARAAHSNDDAFYSQRGIKIHSLEVTRYQCADQSTSSILEAIIQETTNRMNRLSCQESENEVALAKLKGQVEQERASSEVLSIQHQHEHAKARSRGQAEAEQCLAFLSALQESDAAKEARKNGHDLCVDMWRELRRSEALATVSTGNAHVYFTPQDANLTIENRTAPSALVSKGR